VATQARLRPEAGTRHGGRQDVSIEVKLGFDSLVGYLPEPNV
jgi:hypothetical protein